jgi:hypothetical protein
MVEGLIALGCVMVVACGFLELVLTFSKAH